ncbi:hypothetical protein FOMG_03674 [Fusarium oxysporum f. sp. melonis 26406]|uniref:Uncharacterized protein n=5 Tax=Fusarium oxysporum TaxID=5507 RepID=W9J3B7_FUSOX|nr:hypothetical protein FOYG_01266 [Fusarium oxysporum NRRL 32931]EWZ92852.1 hypothetical protein FOWG_05837 [Fusarium oxysporum f. sp. lycopersici MN25]EXK45130.1 hypothetical protein FOMG_03674 [Fusarium oxysporum f. sp. melonis 26406]KAJ0144258.1 RutC family protein C23G10.2 [Fusarium oxysporum f. sp. albedinis]
MNRLFLLSGAAEKNVQLVQRSHTRYSMSNEPTMLAHRRPTRGPGSFRRYGQGEDGLQEMLILLNIVSNN